ncbi:MAG: accessory factor UbiK family protein [Alphaproteobacteria bacterium]
MSSKERILDDMAKMAGGAMQALSSASQQVKGDLKSRAEDMALRLDLVPREDFERLEAMLQESRLKQEEILKRLEALEKSKESKK